MIIACVSVIGTIAFFYFGYKFGMFGWWVISPLLLLKWAIWTLVQAIMQLIIYSIMHDMVISYLNFNSFVYVSFNIEFYNFGVGRKSFPNCEFHFKIAWVAVVLSLLGCAMTYFTCPFNSTLICTRNCRTLGKNKQQQCFKFRLLLLENSF